MDDKKAGEQTNRGSVTSIGERQTTVNSQIASGNNTSRQNFAQSKNQFKIDEISPNESQQAMEMSDADTTQKNMF